VPGGDYTPAPAGAAIRAHLPPRLVWIGRGEKRDEPHGWVTDKKRHYDDGLVDVSPSAILMGGRVG